MELVEDEEMESAPPTFEGGGEVTQFSSADAQAAMGARDLDA